MSGGFRNADEFSSMLADDLRYAARAIGLDLAQHDEAPRLFKELLHKAHEHYGCKVVVLIDEYDKPMLDNIDDIELADQIRKQLRGFYSIIKAADKHLRFVMLTGVSKFSKVSIFSGLNNLKDISLDPRVRQHLRLYRRGVVRSFRRIFARRRPRATAAMVQRL